MADGILAVVIVIRVYVMVGVSLGVILGSVRLSKVQVEMQEIEKRFKNSDRKKMRKIDKGMETGKRAFCFYSSQSQRDRRRRGLTPPPPPPSRSPLATGSRHDSSPVDQKNGKETVMESI
jgi:hypothetical protein